MAEFVVALGSQYLTGFAGSHSWTTNLSLAFGFSDRDAADRQAKRINDLKLGHNKARVETRKNQG